MVAKIKASMDDGFWEFTDGDGNLLFTTDSMDEEVAQRIVRSWNSFDGMKALIDRLGKAVEAHDDYDYALHPDAVKKMYEDFSMNSSMRIRVHRAVTIS